MPARCSSRSNAAAAPKLSDSRFSSRRAGTPSSTAAAEMPTRDLAFFNGLGGFSRDGREYVMLLGPGQTTPAPWVNVIANPQFGTVVSESGCAYTWAENSHEFRLTPWYNDPVTDASGEALYIRDEETGHFWSPSPLPAAARTPTSPATASATACSNTPRTASSPS